LLIESRYLKGGGIEGRRKKSREKKTVVRPSDVKQCGKAADPAKNLFFCAGPSRPASCDNVAPQGEAAAEAPKKSHKKNEAS